MYEPSKKEKERGQQIIEDIRKEEARKKERESVIDNIKIIGFLIGTLLMLALFGFAFASPFIRYHKSSNHYNGAIEWINNKNKNQNDIRICELESYISAIGTSNSRWEIGYYKGEIGKKDTPHNDVKHISIHDSFHLFGGGYSSIELIGKIVEASPSLFEFIPPNDDYQTLNVKGNDITTPLV